MDPIQPPKPQPTPAPTPVQPVTPAPAPAPAQASGVVQPVVNPGPAPAPVAPAPAQSGGIFSGRVGRKGYLIGALYYLLVEIVAFALVAILGGVSANSSSGSQSMAPLVLIVTLIFGLLTLAMLPLILGLQIRRWHDVGQSGWLVLLNFVPFAGFIVLIVVLFIPGTPGPNQYGDQYAGSYKPLSLYGLKP